MTKAIRSYPRSMQPEVVARRLKNKANGLGTISAAGWQKWAGKVVVEVKEEAPVTEEVKE